MKTQKSSESRVHKDGFTKEKEAALYENFKCMTVTEFQKHSIQLVLDSSGSEEKKAMFIRKIRETGKKDEMLVKLVNYFYAGMGLGV